MQELRMTFSPLLSPGQQVGDTPKILDEGANRGSNSHTFKTGPL